MKSEDRSCLIRSGNKDSHRLPNREDVNILSFVTFWWVTRLSLFGWRHKISIDALPQVVTKHQSQSLVHQLNQSVSVSDATSKSFTISNSLVNLFPLQLALSIATSLSAHLIHFARLYLLKLLLVFMLRDQGTSSSSTEGHENQEGYLISVLMLIAAFAGTLCECSHLDIILRMSTQMSTALKAVMYRKSMNLPVGQRGGSEITNLISVDVMHVKKMIEVMSTMWTIPLDVILSTTLLYMDLGPAAFAGLAVMVLNIVVYRTLTTFMRRFHVKILMLKDERAKKIRELLMGIRVIKLNAWEDSFFQVIDKIRMDELSVTMKLLLFRACNLFIFTLTPFLVALSVYGIFVSDEENRLDQPKVFFSIGIIYIIRTAFNDALKLMSQSSATSVSVHRIDSFLSQSDRRTYIEYKDDAVNAITIRDGRFSWTSCQEIDAVPTISLHADVTIRSGCVTAIIGSVGSGKSSLLSAMLGEMMHESGSVVMASRFNSCAYVPQEAWIRNASIRENILFGSAFDQDKYDRIIEACELRPDLALQPAGDETEIGEKGINLSGGQKQRISLARACYSNADLLLLDDPLSAVDSHVGRKLFDNVFSSKTGCLKEKTRILVTNNLSTLNQVDDVIVMDKGVIIESGKYSDLMMSGHHLAKLMSQFAESSGSKEESVMGAGIKNHVVHKTTPGLSKKNDPNVMKQDEARRKDRNVYISYFQRFTISLLVIIHLLSVMYAASNVFSLFWLSRWAADHERQQKNQSNLYWFTGYLIIGSVCSLAGLVVAIVIVTGMMRAARIMHESLLKRILNAPMSLFDETPLGWIVNRFSSDMETIDTRIYEPFYVLMFVSGLTSGSFTIIVIAIPWFLIAVIIMTISILIIQRLYSATASQLTRLESLTSGQIVAHTMESVTGVTSIRAYNRTDDFIHEYDSLIYSNQSCTMNHNDMDQWQSFSLEFIGNLIVFGTSMYAVIFRHDVDPGLIAMSLIYSNTMCRTVLDRLIRVTCEIESNSHSVERVIDYTEIMEQESGLQTKPPSDWPREGGIQFDSYSIRYRPWLDLVLHDMNIFIHPREKVGIVGRTGAGKSSITLALLRMVEPASGRILVDGVDISKIALKELRSKITIIPQDPILYSATLRYNLDPSGKREDCDLWDALRKSHLHHYFTSATQVDGLDFMVSEGGHNLSQGQRQLICLARALLDKTRILIMDEATASVDIKTDSMIQETVREEFSDCTILTIAHRLNTILDSDRVIVMQSGGVAEFDSPANLLKDPRSIFSTLSADAGIDSKGFGTKE